MQHIFGDRPSFLENQMKTRLFLDAVTKTAGVQRAILHYSFPGTLTAFSPSQIINSENTY